ncbi:hypothetical protein [Verrucomicrobium sp. BvORR106]|uniref:hypothetical protein n=1 Tax=Verrucomicrobium sp. BvORR106 TaxID=1403819 RepID=UPI00056FA7A1|nr:hypothetical protein [Verrucomicrobium sp. BvORR106]
MSSVVPTRAGVIYFSVIVAVAVGLYAWKGERTVLSCERKEGQVQARLQSTRLFGTHTIDLAPGSILNADLEESQRYEDGQMITRTKAVLKTSSGTIPLTRSPDGFNVKTPREAVNAINAFLSDAAASTLTVEQDMRGQWALWAGLMILPGLWLLFKGGH